MKANYRDPLDALNALVDAVNRNSELLQQQLDKQNAPTPVLMREKEITTNRRRTKAK